MPRFKADLHLHNVYDFHDCSYGTSGLLSPFDFIDIASKEGYRVLSFTHHGVLYEDSEVDDYAKKKGILLIPGMESYVENKHVLIYNFRQRENIDTFKKLRAYRSDENLVIAPHPFYPSSSCLGESLIANIDCFDALEYCHFYTKYFNWNKKTEQVCEMFNLPIVGSSDAHCKDQIGTTYSLIDASDLSVESIISSIKKGHVEVVSKPLSLFKFIKITLWFINRIRYISGKHARKHILSIKS